MDLIQVFKYSSLIIFASWLTGLLLLLIKKENLFLKKIGIIFIISGILLLLAFIICYWLNIERPPFKTLGETRLWYSLFLSATGLTMFLRWKWNWIIFYCLLLSALFLLMNLLYPENFDKTLMPALQSIWFIPHVIVYILAYSFLGFSMLAALRGLIAFYRKKEIQEVTVIADTIVYIGFSFLTFGLLFGALWAKEAWGNYWTWDPKETWSFITWLVYLIYIHFRLSFKSKNISASLWLLLFAFIIIMICWFGVNYMPSAANSVHVY
ncbi:MAG: cytochrome c biogenesis protein CcsA [Bacteroidales bacterium]|nr:cytochrome c biogenesis protein CcsA [Bacteroidales bacterium]